jgi:hypothetical protein
MSKFQSSTYKLDNSSELTVSSTDEHISISIHLDGEELEEGISVARSISTVMNDEMADKIGDAFKRAANALRAKKLK